MLSPLDTGSQTAPSPTHLGCQLGVLAQSMETLHVQHGGDAGQLAISDDVQHGIRLWTRIPTAPASAAARPKCDSMHTRQDEHACTSTPPTHLQEQVGCVQVWQSHILHLRVR